ncbi:hypothetical protein H8959_018143 [Pygathrix nigripes]
MSCRAVSTAQPSPTARGPELCCLELWALPLGPLPASRQDGQPELPAPPRQASPSQASLTTQVLASCPLVPVC